MCYVFEFDEIPESNFGTVLKWDIHIVYRDLQSCTISILISWRNIIQR